MSEVEITCLGDSAYIPDLGLRMGRGTVLKTTLSAIEKSKDLEFAKLKGLVSIRVMKAQVIRREDFPVANEPSNNHRAVTRAAYHPSPTPSVSDETSVALLRELIQEVRGLREDLRKKPVAQDAPDVSAITGAILSAISGLRAGGPILNPHVSLPKVVSEPEERFIPKGIVSGAAKAEVTTSRSMATDTSGLDDALAALRSAREKRDGERT